MFYSTKRYGHEVGLSTCFRQWKATSHCNQLHGYAIAVTLKFGASSLDSRGWVVDFGALKDLKAWLKDTFDHKTVLASDDPMLPALQTCSLETSSFDIVVLPAVGCEAFAKMVSDRVSLWLLDVYLPSINSIGVAPPDGLHLHSVTVAEHGANSATFIKSNQGVPA